VILHVKALNLRRVAPDFMYNKVVTLAVTVFISMHLSGCSPRQSVLDLNQVTRYDKGAVDQILFLEFQVSEPKNGKKEVVSLVSAVAGNGRMKNLHRPVEYPYQIQVVPRYRTSALAIPLVFEHPLFREVEVPDPSGKITRKEQFVKEGSFTMRMQADPNMEKLDFYSIKPAQEPVRIYTLDLKQ
jgi:hypothetical protein